MPFESSREGQLTEENLKWGYWWTTHKVQVRKGVSIFLAVVDFALIGFVTYGFADWYFGSGVTERQAIAQLARPAIDYAFFRQQDAPAPLLIDPALVIGAGDGARDFVARVENPNSQWIAQFDYRFSAPGIDTPVRRGYLLPGEARWMDALGVRSEGVPTAATISIENLAWKRVNLHLTRPDYVTWSAQRLNFAFKDVTFVPALATDVVPSSRARFTVTNDSGFGYREVTFFVTLISGSRVVGVNRVAISTLRPGESRTVEVAWFNDMPSVSRVEVQPVIDIFNEGAYLAPGQ